jgi:acyl carrier protein
MTLDARVQTVFRQVLAAPDLELQDEMSGADLPGWDSLAHVNAMFGLEEEFGVQFVGDEFARLDSVGAVKDALRRKGVPDRGGA